ncbi:hypothetical protein CsSME_00031747 [Camellia sinensis var. sinensis]
MTMTPYNFAMLTGLRVKGDSIPFDTDMGEWNTVGLYLLSALVILPRVCFYDWSGVGLSTLSLAPEPMEELPLAVPYSRWYDGRWARALVAREAHRATRVTRATKARARGAPREG